MLKRILIISYYFLPFIGVGATRMTKLVKYFSKFGWEITVLTVKDKYYDNSQVDKDILAKAISKYSNVDIIRTHVFKEFFLYKDKGFYWIFPLYSKLKNKLDNAYYDFILFTGDPFFQWLIAPIIKKKYNIPYVLDFRDPWLLDPFNHSKIRKYILGFLEPYVVKNADLVLNVTNEATHMYQNFYVRFNIPKSKFITIENGFDPDDFIELPEVNLQKYKGFKIVYTGKFGEFRNPIPFLEALKEYNYQNNAQKIYFFHIGKKEEIINDFLKSNPSLRQYIIQTGFVPYDKALGYIKAADASLIITGDHPYEPTTKVYDYIALEKPILCISNIKEGYLYNLMQKYPLSIYEKNENRSIIKALLKLMQKNIQLTNFSIESFKRETHFKKLEDILLKMKNLNGEVR